MDKRFKLSLEQIASIPNLYLSGKNQTVIAKSLGVSENCIRKQLLKANVAFRGPFETNRKWTLDESFFDEINTEQKAYFMGLLYADGCLNDGKQSSIVLSLCETDKDILEKFNLALKYDRPLAIIKKYGKAKQDAFTVTVQCRRMYNAVVRFGCTPRKTFTLTYPNFISAELHRHFIRGFFDGDGSMSFNGRFGYVNIVATDMFCQSVASILNDQLGITCNFYKPNLKDKGKNHSILNLRVKGGRQLDKLFHYMYDNSTVYMERKYNKFVLLNQHRATFLKG